MMGPGVRRPASASRPHDLARHGRRPPASPTLHGMTFDGAALMRDLVPTSPYCALLGLSIVELGDGRAVLALPFKDDVITVGRTVHGGAIASLADTAAMAA